MISAKIDGRKALKMLNNLTDYTNGFVSGTKAKEPYIARKLARTSTVAFYEYLDMLARSHPGMLHHVYEWGEVGNPDARLFKLKEFFKNNGAVITADFLQSETSSENTDAIFYNKAEVMEEGITVVVDEVDADALFFVVDGEEFFRAGPIVIANPGGEEVRGSFVEAFEEFYNSYFDQVYLKAIKFYNHVENMNEYYKNFPAAMKSGNASGLGRRTSLSWITRLPGDDYE